jgi:dephospho-CoA kinase
MKHPQRIIGLTGGIATGKTSVSDYLNSVYHFPVFDADIYAREAVAKNSPILTAIFQRYGDKVQLADGCLDRKALGAIIFNDEREKAWLESQIHPYVKNRIVDRLANTQDSTVILAIPLLFEAAMTDLVTEIWVVSCDRTTQMKRLQQRDCLTLEQAQMRIDSQMPLSEKIERADVVLENNRSLEELWQQIDSLIISSLS